MSALKKDIMKHLITLLLAVCACKLDAQSMKADNKIPLLIRCDDIGMCHAVNMAAKEVLETGIPVSMSVMTPCPWFIEGAELLKKYNHVSVGVHLTLNSEWKNYRWGPVKGREAVPTLVDSMGYFHGSRAELFAANPSLKEIEEELRAQIDKAIQAGLKIDYLDYHMGAAVQTPATRSIVEKLASEYSLSISRYYGEEDVSGIYNAPVGNKADTLSQRLLALSPGNVKLLVFHVGLETPETDAMVDLNVSGLINMSKHRHSELLALISREIQGILKQPKYRIVNYRMLNHERGLSSMKRPGSG
jgi:predicted glycoside hydrolase/deacetylase ChbG (UPF0249 family)